MESLVLAQVFSARWATLRSDHHQRTSRVGEEAFVEHADPIDAELGKSHAPDAPVVLFLAAGDATDDLLKDAEGKAGLFKEVSALGAAVVGIGVAVLQEVMHHGFTPALGMVRDFIPSGMQGLDAFGQSTRKRKIHVSIVRACGHHVSQLQVYAVKQLRPGVPLGVKGALAKYRELILAQPHWTQFRYRIHPFP